MSVYRELSSGLKSLSGVRVLIDNTGLWSLSFSHGHKASWVPEC